MEIRSTFCSKCDLRFEYTYEPGIGRPRKRCDECRQVVPARARLEPAGPRTVACRACREDFEFHYPGYGRKRTLCTRCGKKADALKKYGVSIDWYWKTYWEQDGKCFACGEAETHKDATREATRLLSVDHCHVSGSVRHLLCGSCNTALGLMGESVEKIKRLWEYAERCRTLRAA